MDIFNLVMTLLLVGILIACVIIGMNAIMSSVEYSELPKPELQRVRVGYGVHRTYDEEASVYCWTYKDGFGADVDCLPCKDTTLGCE